MYVANRFTFVGYCSILVGKTMYPNRRESLFDLAFLFYLFMMWTKVTHENTMLD